MALWFRRAVKELGHEVLPSGGAAPAEAGSVENAFRQTHEQVSDQELQNPDRLCGLCRRRPASWMSALGRAKSAAHLHTITSTSRTG